MPANIYDFMPVLMCGMSWILCTLVSPNSWDHLDGLASARNTVQIFSGKPGVRNAGFRFRMTDWRGLVIEWRKRQACHPNPPKSFPQAGEALLLASQKICCNFRRSGATTSITRTRIQQQHIIPWLVARMSDWYTDISTSYRSTASVNAAISLHMCFNCAIVKVHLSQFVTAAGQFWQHYLTALSASSVLRCSFRHVCWKVPEIWRINFGSETKLRKTRNKRNKHTANPRPHENEMK